MCSPGRARSSAGSAATSVRLRALAPWLPPKASKAGGASARRGGISKNCRRTGTPVTRAPRKQRAVSGKCTAAAATMGASTRLAKPGTTLGSKASVGIPPSAAASMAGPEA